jgi:hypothetical protein
VRLLIFAATFFSTFMPASASRHNVGHLFHYQIITEKIPSGTTTFDATEGRCMSRRWMDDIVDFDEGNATIKLYGSKSDMYKWILHGMAYT